MVQQKGDLKLKKYLFIAFYSRISGFNYLFSVFTSTSELSNYGVQTEKPESLDPPPLNYQLNRRND